MSITIQSGGPLRSLFGGKRELDIEAATIGEVLDKLDVRKRLCKEDGSIRRYVSIHINHGEDVRLLQGPDTPVNDGDTVTILTAIGGGNRSF